MKFSPRIFVLASLPFLPALWTLPQGADAADFVSFQEIVDTLELGRPAELKALLVKNPELAKARITKGDHTALGSIAGRGDADALKMAKILFDFGADPDARDIDGQTPLYAVAFHGGSIDMAKLLIKKKAKVNLADRDGRTPLHAAASEGASGIVRLLLNHGADPNRADKNGRTPLHSAAQCFTSIKPACAQGLRFLLKAGAKLDTKDSEGRSPLETAEYGKNSGIAEILRKAGGL